MSSKLSLNARLEEMLATWTSRIDELERRKPAQAGMMAEPFGSKPYGYYEMMVLPRAVKEE
jgi:hypothetical protein